VFTRACHWTLSWARWIQSTHSFPIPLRYVFKISCCLHLGFPSGLCLTILWQKFYIHFLSIPCILQALPISSSFIWLP
jgi:hypothetical protein